jgi:hypothetical protein
MRALCVSDTVDEQIYRVESRPYLSGVEVVLAAGDLPGTYLEFLADLLDVPVYFVFGNHAEEYVRAEGEAPRLPWGCICLDDRVVRHRSLGNPARTLLLAGLGGSRRYRPGPHQYNEAEMFLRAARLVPHLLVNGLRAGRFLDVLLTHAPPWGIQDGPDRPHQGFRAFRWLIARFHPRYLVHGHYDPYDRRVPRETSHGGTVVVNSYGHHLLEVADGF